MTREIQVTLDLPEIHIVATVTVREFENTEGGGGHLNRTFTDYDIIDVEIDEADGGETEVTPHLLKKWGDKIVEAVG